MARIAETVSSRVVTEATALSPAGQPSPKNPVMSFMRSLPIPVLLLALTYFLLVIDIETRPWKLRVALMVVSAVAAFVDRESLRRSSAWNFTLAGAVAILSNVAMNFINYLFHHVPVYSLASNWVDEVSYTLSVALSFITGILLTRTLSSMGSGSYGRHYSPLTLSIATAINGRLGSAKKIEKYAHAIQACIKTAAALGAACTAAVMGLHSLIK